MSQIKIGIAGCGRRIKDVLQRFLNQNPQVEIVAFFDKEKIYAENFSTSFGGGTVYTSYEKMLKNSGLNWVFITSRNSEHAEQILMALDLNIHIFAEKPIAITYQDCLKIYQKSKTSLSKFMIGFTLRFSPHYRKIKELIASGKIGNIISFEFNENITPWHGSHIMCNWRRLRKYTGFHLLEKCCHDIDIANWMVQSRAKKVASFGGRNFFTKENNYLFKEQNIKDGKQLYERYGENAFETEKDIVDNQVCILEYENGIRGMFHTNLNTAIAERRLLIVGSKGTIRSDVITGKLELGLTGLIEEIIEIPNDVKGGHGGGDDILVKELYEYMLDDKEPSTTIKDGLESAIVCFGLDQAQTKSKVVDMKDYWLKLSSYD